MSNEETNNVIQLTPVETPKVERVLGGDIETMSLEDLESAFDKFSKKINKKKYRVKMSQDIIAFLLHDLMPNVEWVGQQAWDLESAMKVVGDLKPDESVLVTKESIRSIFQFAITSKQKGTDNVRVLQELLNNLANVVTKINSDEQLLRNAGFELEAATQGVTPETKLENSKV